MSTLDREPRTNPGKSTPFSEPRVDPGMGRINPQSKLSTQIPRGKDMTKAPKQMTVKRGY